jgi:DNA-binding beta-propeller fold protein YncE
MSTDNKRIFVLNRGGDAANPGGSITVINSQSNALDSCTPYQSQNGQWVTCHPSIALPAGPVYAEFNTTTQQLVVANYDSNTISVIDVTLDQYGNDYNTYANPTCTVNGVTSYANCGAITGGFGTTYTIPVGNNPASVTALADGSRAYTANQTDGTVTIVNLTDHTVEKTLTVVGHPRTVVSTQNSLYGKVYVASPDSPYLTIISTLNDLVDTTVLIEGNIVDVRVSTQNGSSGNNNDTSRVPGLGQPCNLPPSLEPTPTGTQTAGQVCQEMP